MNALDFLVHTLLQLAVYVMLGRLLMQWVRADFRNPISQGVVRLTNPLVLPLRKILPPIGKIDTASVVVLIALAALDVWVRQALRGSLPPYPSFWVAAVLYNIAQVLLTAYFWMIILYALLSLVSPGDYSPLASLLSSLCEPLLRPFRRLIPPLGGLDLSPLWVLLIIQMLLYYGLPALLGYALTPSTL